MAESEDRIRLTLEELMVSTLSMTHAVSKLLIEKSVITDPEPRNWVPCAPGQICGRKNRFAGVSL